MIREDKDRGVHVVDMAPELVEALSNDWSAEVRMRIEDDEMVMRRTYAEDVVSAARELLAEDLEAGDGEAVTDAEKELEAALERYDELRSRP